MILFIIISHNTFYRFFTGTGAEFTRCKCVSGELVSTCCVVGVVVCVWGIDLIIVIWLSLLEVKVRFRMSVTCVSPLDSYMPIWFWYIFQFIIIISHNTFNYFFTGTGAGFTGCKCGALWLYFVRINILNMISPTIPTWSFLFYFYISLWVRSIAY